MKVLAMPEQKLEELPEILNTIENSYSTIYVVGDGNYGNIVWDYWKENKNICLKKIESSSLSFDGQRYVLQQTNDGEAIVVFTDLYEERPVVDPEGKGFQTFYFLRYYYNDIKTTENLQDIDMHIIPRLLDHEVNVIKVYVPDINRLKCKPKVRRRMLYWNVLRHLFPELFDRKRRRLEHTEYLKEEVHALTNDNSKGYSRMYGNGTYINFDNGFRRTVGNPSGDMSQIYFFGPCFIRGLGCCDDDTIPSQIQAKTASAYRVLNYGSEFQTGCYIMRSLEYRSGDIAVIFSPDRKKKNAAVDDRLIELDLTDVYNRTAHLEQHVFDLLVHFDMTVQKQIVEAVYAKIVEIKTKSTGSKTELSEPVIFGPQIKRAADLRFCKDEHFRRWLTDFSKSHPYQTGRKRGAIVMNCNPFTLGHRYLIETAAAQVDELIIFVVQEDKSFFAFADRIRLVKLGTADLTNVIVTESGNYMISNTTLPGYFDKADLQDTYLDASGDLTLFTQIATFLQISVRFAGEEPKDRFTRMYNRNMKRILPRYGIEFVEIPRKEAGAEAISASRVRAAIKDKDIETIRELVPDTTYEFLRSKYNL
jgi:[citrate (pro-3S)-lyase] ligase